MLHMKVFIVSILLQHDVFDSWEWDNVATIFNCRVYQCYPVHVIESEMSFGQKCYITATVYPKKYAHGFCFAVLCCGYTLTDFPISIRLTSPALWQSNESPSASKATLMNMDKYFMWIHYERLHSHNKAKHNKTVCIFLGIYCNKEYLVSSISVSVYGKNHQLCYATSQHFR